jgi:hypothetical protein
MSLDELRTAELLQRAIHACSLQHARARSFGGCDLIATYFAAEAAEQLSVIS